MLAALVFGGCISQSGSHQHKTMTIRLDKIAMPLLAQNISLAIDMDVANTLVLLKQDDRANASTDGETVYITTGLMSRVSDLAMTLIIAHELGHISLGHYWSESPPNQLEQEADRYGLFLLARAGLDYRSAVLLSTAAQSPHKSGMAPFTDEAKRAAYFRTIIAEIETLKVREISLIP